MDSLSAYWGKTIASMAEVDMTEKELVVNTEKHGQKCIKSLNRLQNAEKDGWLILFPHDSKKWDTFKKYYD